MVSSLTMKGVSSVIGALIVEIIQGSVYTWSNINTYYVSYLKENGNQSIQLVDGYFIMPIIMSISMGSGVFGPKIDYNLGIKACTFISLIMICISHLLLIKFTDLYYVYGAMALFGLGSGISFVAVLRNSWLYFPKRKGLVTGIILFGMGSSAFIFTGIADRIINPNFVQLDPNTGFFPPEVSQRTYKYIVTLNIIIGILSIIGYLMIFDQYKIENDNKIIVKVMGHENDNKVALVIEKDKHDIEIKAPVLQAFKHIQIWQILTMDFCTLYFSFLCLNTYRAFGQLNYMNEGLLSLLSICSPILNGISRIVWGALFDYFNFKTLYFFLIFVETIMSFSFYYVGSYEYIYFAMVCVNAFVFSGYIVVLLPMYPKIYGVKYSTQVYGIATSLSGLSSLMSPIVAKWVVHELTDYNTLYFSGAILVVLSSIVCFFFKETKFRYEEEEIDEKELENIKN